MPAIVESLTRQALAPAISEDIGSSFTTTTLYDLMAAMHAGVEPDEDRAVIARVDALLRAGRITFLKNVKAPFLRDLILLELAVQGRGCNRQLT